MYIIKKDWEERLQPLLSNLQDGGRAGRQNCVLRGAI